jgi:hypothetical protein
MNQFPIVNKNKNPLWLILFLKGHSHKKVFEIIPLNDRLGLN